MTNLFHVIDDVQCITRSKGVYRQVTVHRKGDEIFARHGNGFIRLLGHGATSHPDVSLIDMEAHKDILSKGGPLKSPKWTGAAT